MPTARSAPPGGARRTSCRPLARSESPSPSARRSELLRRQLIASLAAATSAMTPVGLPPAARRAGASTAEKRRDGVHRDRDDPRAEDVGQQRVVEGHTANT